MALQPPEDPQRRLLEIVIAFLLGCMIFMPKALIDMVAQ